LVLKRKRKREYAKDIKFFRSVFDERTSLVLYRLLNKKGMKAESIVKEGKESIILSGSSADGPIAIKVYRKRADFKVMWRYIVGDPRFKRMKKRRQAMVSLWCRREFKNLKTAYNKGVICPKPLAMSENILIMSFIGEDNVPAPRLIDIKLENPKKVYNSVIKNLKLLIKAGLIHGDLSAYNILMSDKPYFIDLSHGTVIKNPMAEELLKRDIKNTNSYFSKLNVNIKDSKKLFEELMGAVQRKDRT